MTVVTKDNNTHVAALFNAFANVSEPYDQSKNLEEQPLLVRLKDEAAKHGFTLQLREPRQPFETRTHELVHNRLSVRVEADFEGDVTILEDDFELQVH
jgi:hypothetical protein